MDREKFYKGIEDIKGIGMNENEKFLLKSRLDIYIKNNTPKSVLVSPWYSFNVIHSRSFGAVFSLMLVVLVGYNTFIFAENSLPGDKLYSLKVDVIEPIQYSIALDQVSKANLDVHNFDTRLREAELLEVSGKLSDTVLVDLENRINSHSESFNLIVNNIDSTSEINENSDVRINFEAKVNAHSRIIEKIEADSSSENGNIRKIKDVISKNKIRENSNSESGVSLMMLSSVEDTKVAEKSAFTVQDVKIGTSTEDKFFIEKKKDTEKIIKQTKENIKRVKKTNKVNKEILEDAVNSIKEAEEKLKSAIVESGDGESDKAFTSLMDSRRKVNEANTSFEVSKSLDGIVQDKRRD